MRAGVVVLALLAIAQSAAAATANLVQNGSFEANGGANSNLLNGWTAVDEAGGNGAWLAQMGVLPPATPELTCTTEDVPAPPDGSFSAMTTMTSEGSHVLYQDIAVPAGASATLSFRYYVRSAASLFSADTLSYHVQPNQQFRVDVVEPSGDPFTLDVLQNILVIGTGNSDTGGYELQTATLAGFGGRTIRLRFAEVDNQACFNIGVDDVRLEVVSQTPAPAIVRFTVSPPNIRYAASSTLTWVTQNATSVEIDNGIGPVPLSGSRSVSLQEDAHFKLTASGVSGSSARIATVHVSAPGPDVSFSASPSFVEKGQPSTLMWLTDASEVSISPDVGPVAASGSITVTPQTTTEYTLAAKGDGLTTTSRATVFVDPGDVPIVSVTAFPSGVVQVAGGLTPSSDQYAVTNLGKVATTVTLSQHGDFFTQSPQTFTLPPGATQVVALSFHPQSPGKYEGTSLLAGTGVPGGLSVPVRLFVATAPTGTVIPTTAVVRTEISAPASENPSGSVTFTNSGTGTLQGIAVSDAAWLIPQNDAIVIGAGQTKPVTFTTNRALRPDASSSGGAATATLTLVYVDSGASSVLRPVSQGGGSNGSISVTIVDIVKPGAAPGGPPPLAAGEVAYFVPGLTQRSSSAGDLFLSVVGSSIADLRLYLGAPGKSPISGALDQIAPNGALALPSVMKSVFASTAPVGTVQARSGSLLRVLLGGLQTTTVPELGSFVTALPMFRSDQAASAGSALYMTGLEKSAARSTNVIVQEVAGLSGSVKLELLDAAGVVVSSRDETLDAFGLLSIPDAISTSAVSLRITNTSSTAARVVAYAQIVDSTTGDGWVVEARTLSDDSREYVVGIVPSGLASGRVTDAVDLLNPNAQPIEVSMQRFDNTVHRRSVRADATGSSSAVTVASGQALHVPVDFLSGYLRLTASQPFVLASRSTIRVSGRAGEFGSALPLFSNEAALTLGQSRRFGGLDDSTRATVLAATPLTFRTNLGLIETAGHTAVVRLTLRYAFSAGAKSTAQGLSTTTIEIPASRLLMLSEVARTVIGSSRDLYGDLHNMQLDVEVIGGSGRLFPFVQAIDNGSGDAAIRTR